MKEKGFDLSRAAPKAIFQVPNLDHYNVIVGVAAVENGQMGRSGIMNPVQDELRAASGKKYLVAEYESQENIKEKILQWNRI